MSHPNNFEVALEHSVYTRGIELFVDFNEQSGTSLCTMYRYEYRHGERISFRSTTWEESGDANQRAKANYFTLDPRSSDGTNIWVRHELSTYEEERGGWYASRKSLACFDDRIWRNITCDWLGC